jgi:hypothetical protein
MRVIVTESSEKHQAFFFGLPLPRPIAFVTLCEAVVVVFFGRPRGLDADAEAFGLPLCFDGVLGGASDATFFGLPRGLDAEAVLAFLGVAFCLVGMITFLGLPRAMTFGAVPSFLGLPRGFAPSA